MEDVDLPDGAETLIEKVALKNAVEHDGRGRAGPVVSALLGEHPSLKEEMAVVKPYIDGVVNEVNGLGVEAQRDRLLDIDPEALASEEPNTDPLKEIELADDTAVVTAFPPAPEKYPHIGHAKALYLNKLLSDRYDGDFLLRFEDTNPISVESEYYQAMINDFEWLGADFDEVVYASDHMQLFYQQCRGLIENGDAYVAEESAERISKARREQEPLMSRSNTVEENKSLWEDFVRGSLEGAVVLLKGDMGHKNSTMRDPALMRQVEADHARQGNRFSAWPTYDFQTTCLDGEYGVTHRIRSKEFELRNELHRYLQEKMGYDVTKIYEFARFEVEDAIVSGREIRSGIEEGRFDGWDDPQLMTLRSLKRRGFHPDAIRSFVLETGLSKTEAKRPIDELYQANYDAVIDDAVSALFVEAGVDVDVEGTTVHVHSDVSSSLETGVTYETWDGYKFRYGVDGSTRVQEAQEIIEAVSRQASRSATLVMPDGSRRHGQLYVDGDCDEGKIVRIKNEGFARIDDTAANTLWFAH